MTKLQYRGRLVLAAGLIPVGWALLLASPEAATAGDSKLYEPTRESLSQYEVPEWFHDAKIGFFYHWGPHSVIGDHWNDDVMDFCRQQGKYEGSNLAKRNPPGQWAANMYPTPGKPQSEQNSCSLLQRAWYGDQLEFGYKDLIPLMTGAEFDPEEMVRLLAEAGVRYLAAQAIHHDGFAMWDSRVIDRFNAARMGPKRDTVRIVVEHARRRGMKAGVSTHAARHSWYYPKPAGYDVADSRYVQLYGEGLGEGGLPRPEAIQKWKDTLGELVVLFSPDYIFVDGGTADTYCNKQSYVVQDAFREIVAHYYNHALANGYEPVLTFKRESLYKEEAVPDYEGGALIDIAPYKWQTHANIAGWFYRPGQRVVPSHRLFQKIIDVVSKNGNILLNLGLRADGSIPETEVAFLEDMADWTRVVGDGLFGSRPWLVYGEIEPRQEFFFREHSRKGIVYDDPQRIKMGTTKNHDGDIRYTRSKDRKTIYATRMSWPEEAFTLRSFADGALGEDVAVETILLLGSDEQIQWKRTDNGIVIEPPSTPVFENRDWPVMFTLKSAARTSVQGSWNKPQRVEHVAEQQRLR